MLPHPLHPAIVHVPIALAALLPVLALAGVVAIRTAWLPRRAWSVVVLLAGLLVLGSWVALETGEEEEELVERVVAEELIEAHEEAAETFAALGVVLFLAAGAGLRAGRFGEVARSTSVLVALALLVAGARVGHLGGALVYTHGAADAHRSVGTETGLVEDHGHDDDEEDSDAH